MKKQISGNFDLTEPYALIERLSAQMGLIWYDDGKAIYIYDSSEMRNALINLRKVSTNEFNNFLKNRVCITLVMKLKGAAMVLSMYRGHRFMLTWSLMLQN